jgi:hypothetical protein
VGVLSHSLSGALFISRHSLHPFSAGWDFPSEAAGNLCARVDSGTEWCFSPRGKGAAMLKFLGFSRPIGFCRFLFHRHPTIPS